MDLQHHYQIDLRDLWRFGPDGRRLLTARRLGVLLRGLPANSSIRRALDLPTWTPEIHMLADIWAALVKVDHPARPVPPEAPDPEREERVAALKVDAAERQRAIDAGEIT
ncbi:MAG: hypothetical protein PSX37_08915 [bacterium]|nr:hypothetical protein [bacterium]